MVTRSFINLTSLLAATSFTLNNGGFPVAVRKLFATVKRERGLVTASITAVSGTSIEIFIIKQR
jgi:hypothetical protein